MREEKPYKNMPEASEGELKGLKEAYMGIRCPNCGDMITDKTLKAASQMEFSYDPEPHYSWVEVHQCNSCETRFKLKNGT
jgi:predicted RNA-binding Zn-ribbon protein involved in translation (DUF1610 family)